jgi:hypothetical protein
LRAAWGIASLKSEGLRDVHILPGYSTAHNFEEAPDASHSDLALLRFLPTLLFFAHCYLFPFYSQLAAWLSSERERPKELAGTTLKLVDVSASVQGGRIDAR